MRKFNFDYNRFVIKSSCGSLQRWRPPKVRSKIAQIRLVCKTGCMKIRITLLTLLLTQCSAALASAPKEDLFNQGVALINAKRYQESASCLALVAKENPKNALVHYYLALALVHLGKWAEARQEFFACYCLDPQGPTGKYAQEALSAYRSEVGAANTVESDPINDPSFKKTLAVVHEQAEREKSRKTAAAESLALGAAATAETQVSRIQSASAPSLGVTPYVGLSDKYQSTTPLGTPLAQVEESIRLARLSARQKSADYRSWSQSEQRKVEDVAHNLESQLKNSHIPGQAVLKTQGTGFYVRYYGPTDPRTRVPEVHPGVVRILDPNSSAYDVEDLSEDSKKEEAPKKSVKGTVLSD